MNRKSVPLILVCTCVLLLGVLIGLGVTSSWAGQVSMTPGMWRMIARSGVLPMRAMLGSALTWGLLMVAALVSMGGIAALTILLARTQTND